MSSGSASLGGGGTAHTGDGAASATGGGGAARSSRVAIASISARSLGVTFSASASARRACSAARGSAGRSGLLMFGPTA
jgi:hypothetical protein